MRRPYIQNNSNSTIRVVHEVANQRRAAVFMHVYYNIDICETCQSSRKWNL